MEDLIKALIVEQRYLDDIEPELISSDENDPDRVLVQIMKGLRGQKIEINISTIQDQLKEHGENGDGLLMWFNNRMNVIVERSADYIVRFLRDRNNTNQLFRIYNQGLRSLNESRPEAVVQWVEQETRSSVKFSTNIAEDQTHAVTNAFERLKRVYKGQKLEVHETGYELFDRYIGLSYRQIVVLAAKQKMGKTRLALNLVRNMLKRNQKLNCHWLNFECSNEEMLAMSIAMETGIDTNVVRAKTKMPTDDELLMIGSMEDILREEPIKWYPKPMNILGIQRSMAQCDENSIIVIDNLGLITAMPNMTEVQNDNNTASGLKMLRDETGALVFVLHHLSKSSEHFSRKADHFEPNASDVRGSARIADYCNTMLLMHRVSEFKQLRSQFTEEQWEELKSRLLLKAETVRDSPGCSIKFEHQLNICRFKEAGLAPE